MSKLTVLAKCLLSYFNPRRQSTDIKETATAVNFTLMKLISLHDKENDALRPQTDHEDAKSSELDIKSIVDVLTQYLSHNSVQTKVAVLRWIHHLYVNVPSQMYQYIDLLFPALQRTLSDPADEVVQQCLVVIAEIISSQRDTIKTEGSIRDTNPYYSKFVISLLHSFSNDKTLLDDRGSFIIRQLCVLLNAEDIYRTLAEILLTEPNLKFASLMVEQLNLILLTSSELFELRARLKELASAECCALFKCLYRTWCHNPVATLALCLLSQSYTHACDLIRLFANLEITVDFLTEIDKLVQLIESPIFAFMRLELLEVPCDRNLVRALYGLLMLLPQTEVFHKLYTRLGCIPSLHLHCDNKSQTEIKPIPERMKNIDFSQLLQHFINVQSLHADYKKVNRAKEMSTLGKDLANGDV